MIVHPESTEDVAKIVKIAVKYKTPITPYSGGSRTSELYVQLCQFWFRAPNRISQHSSCVYKLTILAEEDSDLVCQAGARWMDVNETLKEKGRLELRKRCQIRRRLDVQGFLYSFQ